MSEPIIVARNVTKTFTRRRNTAVSFKEMVVANQFDRGELITHNALDDLSFEVERGRSFAVVGHNGSGKSTLLRLIAGITDPSSGTLEVRGRVAALLELGAGFHPELTGMENIFLLCGIYGLTREETLARLDNILAFCELDRFIHTPAKRYSTGMMVRLGFSIALHVDADILLLDEVLAVGDGYFQTKCLRAIDKLRDRGQTVFIVSHNHVLVETIAERVLWLDHGKQRMMGTAETVLDAVFDDMQEGVRRVTQNVHAGQEHELTERDTVAVARFQAQGREARLARVRLLDPAGGDTRRFELDKPLTLELEVVVREKIPQGLALYMSFGSATGGHAAHFEDHESLREAAGAPGNYRVRVAFPTMHLHPGRYVITIVLAEPGKPNNWFDMHLRMYPITLRQPGERMRNFEETLLPTIGGFVANSALGSEVDGTEDART